MVSGPRSYRCVGTKVVVGVELMDVDQLRTFLAVLEHSSFSRAAHALRIGQSTVSFHVKTLETILETRLLDRLGGRVRPTAAGRLLERYAHRIVTLREEAILRLRAEKGGEIGQIRIAASTIPAEYLLPPVLAELRRRHPAVAVTVDISDSRRAITSLLAEECDIALVGARVPDKRIVYTPFADDEIVLVGPMPNSFAPSLRLTGAELAHVPIVMREEGAGTRAAVSGLIARHAGRGLEGTGSIQVGSTEAAKRCVREGLGLTFVSRRAVAEEIATKRLSLVAFPGTPVHRHFQVARARSASMPMAARILVRLLQENR